MIPANWFGYCLWLVTCSDLNTDQSFLSRRHGQTHRASSSLAWERGSGGLTLFCWSGSRFLHRSDIDIWGYSSLSWGFPAHVEMFNSLSGLNPLDDSSTPSSPQSWLLKLFPGWGEEAVQSPRLRTTGLDWGSSELSTCASISWKGYWEQIPGPTPRASDSAYVGRTQEFYPPGKLPGYVDAFVLSSLSTGFQPVR